MTTYTIVGNLTAQPELKHTPAGTPVTRARVACNPTTRKADGSLVNLEAVFHDVQLWRALAERFCELATGTAVVVVGEFRSSTYETPEGQRRTRTYLHATAGGPDLARMEVAGVTRPAGATKAAAKDAHAPAGEHTTSEPGPGQESDEGFDIDAILGGD